MFEVIPMRIEHPGQDPIDFYPPGMPYEQASTISVFDTKMPYWLQAKCPNCEHRMSLYEGDLCELTGKRTYGVFCMQGGCPMFLRATIMADDVSSACRQLEPVFAADALIASL